MTTTSKAEHRAPRPRRRLFSVRARLGLVAVVAISALLALVAVNAARDWDQQRNLANDSATGELGGEASIPLYFGTQAERRLTAAYLAWPTTAGKKALDEQRVQTDKAVALFRRLSGAELETDQRHKWSYVERIYRTLDDLDATRRRADDHPRNADEITGFYSTLLAQMVEFYQQLSAMDDASLTLETRPLVGLFWAGEGLAQEDMLIAQARATGTMSARHRADFAEAYGSQRVMYERWIAPYLPPKDRATYDRIVHSPAWHTKERIEQALIAAPTTSSSGALGTLPGELSQWDAAYRTISQQINGLNTSRTQGLLAHGYQRAHEIRTQVYWQVGGSLAAIAVIAFLIVSLVLTVIRSTNRVRTSALAAEETLPTIVRDLQHGRKADRTALPQPLPHPHDEFDQVINAVALLAAQGADAAETVYNERLGFAAFTQAVSSRAGVIVGPKLLTLLDQMEQDYGNDPKLLALCYALNHEVVYARRLLENLQVLAGGQLDHPHDRPVHVANLLMDAAGESAGFKRVVKDFRAEAWIKPEAAAELTHLLAELIDNATRFSAEEFEVTVRSVDASAGVAIEVEDRGQRVPPEQLKELNARLSEVWLYSSLAQTSDQLGLFVVGQLAQRLGVKVTLRESRFWGVEATVLVPYELLIDAPELDEPAEPGPAKQPPGALPPEVTDSGLVKRTPSRTQPPQTSALPLPPEAAPPSSSPAPSPAPVPQPRMTEGVPQLPQRKPGTHLAEQLRNHVPSTRHRQAMDQRPLDEIEADFNALDHI